MARIIITYGLISGFIIICGIMLSLQLNGVAPHANLAIGYLIMLIALSSILVGVKQYRDQTLGGVIRFRPAFLLGLGIAAVASLAYVALWEVYLAVTDYAFIDAYTAQFLETQRAAGVSGAAYEKLVTDMDAMRRQYANPVFRLATTFAEIFPVGLLIALVSAALLRKPGFLPARGRAKAELS